MVLSKCKKCGECCTTKHSIGWVVVYPSDIKRWKMAGIFRNIRPLLTTSSIGETGLIIDYDNHKDQCPFLLKNNGTSSCRIHSEWGYNMKPKDCRMFPCNDDLLTLYSTCHKKDGL